MNKCLYPRQYEPYKVFFTWQITYNCNYKCTYCNAPKHGQQNAVDTIILNKQEWIKIWDNIYDMYGECEINISGGEPTLYPNFFEIVKEISKIHKVTIITNLSFDIKTISLLDKKRVKFNASYHSEFVDINCFINKIIYMQELGFDVQADFVTWPPFLDKLDKIQKQFYINAIDLVVHPFVGVYNNIRYPINYSINQKQQLLNIFNDEYNKRNIQFNIDKQSNNTKKLCRMGENYAFIKPNGDVNRCCKEKTYLGNIKDRTFKLLEEAKECSVSECNCWKCMIVGREKDWNGHWKQKIWSDPYIVYFNKIEKYKNMFIKKEIKEEIYLNERNRWINKIKDLFKKNEKTTIVPMDNFMEMMRYGQEIVDKREGSYNGNMLICIAKKEKGEIESALKYANKLIELDRSKVDGYELKGELELIKGKEEGYKNLDKAIDISILKEREIERVIKILGEIVKKGIREYKEVEKYIEEKRTELNKVVGKNNEKKEEIEEEIISIKGEVLKKEERYDEMMRYGQEIVDKREGSYNGNMLICIAKKEKGEIESALKYANKLIELDRSKVDGYELKGELELIKGNEEWYKILDKIFELCVKNERKIYNVICNMIASADKDNIFIKLEQYILKIKNTETKNKLIINLYMKQINVYIKKHMLKEAMDLAVKAIKLDRNNYDILSILGLLNIFNNEHYKAREYLMKAIKVDNKKVFAYVLFGRLNLEQNNVKETKKMFQKALNLSKENNDKEKTLNMLFSELQHVKYSPLVDKKVILTVQKWLETVSK